MNALVWRVHERAAEKAKKRPDRHYLVRLSMARGRSMCPHCHHELAARDLIPVLSWLSLRGKCRYCHKAIPDSPAVELSLPVLFIVSYIFWPVALSGSQLAVFVLWLGLLVGFLALAVYDLRWMLLPNRLVYPLSVIAAGQAGVRIVTAQRPLGALIQTLLAVAVGGGIFYLLFQISSGKWIGGGDVKLGWLLGLTVATPGRSLLMIFLAAFTGSLISVPLLINGRLKRNATIPFGPFLILGAILVQLFGSDILSWYKTTLLR